MPEERIAAAAERIVSRILSTHPSGDDRDELVAIVKNMADEVTAWDRRTGTTTIWKWPFPEKR